MGKQWPDFGDRLARLIHEKGYKNAAQFADAAGIRITYVYKWLGGTIPERENIEMLASKLDVAPAWLLFGDEVDRTARPMKRARKALVCLLGALSLTTSGAVPSQARTLPLVETGPTSDNGRCIMSGRRRRAIWRAACEFWSDRRVGVSLIPSCNPVELRAS